MRFNQEIIDLLLESSWWDWPLSVLKSNRHLFDYELDSLSIEKLRLAFSDEEQC